MLHTVLLLAVAGQVALGAALPQPHQTAASSTGSGKNRPAYFGFNPNWGKSWRHSSSAVAPTATGYSPRPTSSRSSPKTGGQGSKGHGSEGQDSDDQDSEGQDSSEQDSSEGDDEGSDSSYGSGASSGSGSSSGSSGSRATGRPAAATSKVPAPTNAAGSSGQAPVSSSTPGSIWQPAAGTQFQMILSAPLAINVNSPSVTPDVEVYDIDLFDNDATSIQALHKLGKKVVCYFSAGTSETWRSDYKSFKSADEGAALPDWEGEKWLNIKSSSVFDVMKARIQLASQKGCDAIDPDNVDVYGNQDGGGFSLTKQDSITYVQQLAAEAKKYNMATGLKNAQEILSSVQNDIQFAVNEECATDNSCGDYNKFLDTNKPVFHVEYVDQSGKSRRAAPSAEDSEDTVSISSASIAGQTSSALRTTFCQLSSSSKGSSKLSTAIKEMNLNGWIMDCSGNVQTTATKASTSSGKYSRR